MKCWLLTRREVVELMRARLVSGTRFRTSEANERRTNLAPFHFQTVDCKHDLLQLYRCSTCNTLDPCTFDTNPFSQREEYMGRSHNRGIHLSRIKKNGVFNSMEDVEIG